jgi:Bcr/CflA subfamily drug resistance transporter
MNFALLIIVLLATLPQISADIYTPSLPAIAQYFHCSLGDVQASMAFFVAGVAITTLIYGPISEGVGRQRTLVFGILIALVGTLLCVFASGIVMLQWARLLQGCGLGACSALWRSVFRDQYSGKALVRMSAYLLNCVVLSVILAPLLGGYLQSCLGWRASFVFVSLWMLIVLLIMSMLFQETSEHHGRHRLKLAFIVQTYLSLLAHRVFMGYALIAFAAYGGLFTWLTAGPVVLIHSLGLSPVVYGYVMIFSGLATALSGFVNRRLTVFLSLHSILLLGVFLMLVAGIAMFIANVLFGLTVYVVVIFAVIFVFASTLVFMNCFALGFEPVGHIAGYAGSLYACIQMLGGVVFGVILAHVNTHTAVPMALLFAASAVFSYVAYRWLARPSMS